MRNTSGQALVELSVCLIGVSLALVLSLNALIRAWMQNYCAFHTYERTRQFLMKTKDVEIADSANENTAEKLHSRAGFHFRAHLRFGQGADGRGEQIVGIGTYGGYSTEVSLPLLDHAQWK